MTDLDAVERLIRFHRQNVFGPDGDQHTAEILRLKALPVWQEADQHRRAMDLYRRSEALLRAYA